MAMAALVRLVAMVASAILLFGFLAFAVEQADKGSNAQIEKLEDRLGSPELTTNQERVREREHGAIREAIDDANDVLLSPFTGIVESNDPWARRLVPTVLALLVFGVGLALLANYLPKPAGHTRDWRAPQS